MNNISVLHPYKYKGQWVFDDPEKDLIKEAFIAGSDEIISKMAEGKDKITVLFSGEAFPGHQLMMEWTGEEMSGNWYHCVSLDMHGWLCPSLLKYFDEVPRTIYAQFKPVTE